MEAWEEGGEIWYSSLLVCIGSALTPFLFHPALIVSSLSPSSGLGGCSPELPPYLLLVLGLACQAEGSLPFP